MHNKFCLYFFFVSHSFLLHYGLLFKKMHYSLIISASIVYLAMTARPFVATSVPIYIF